MERSKAIQLLNFGIFCDGGHTKFPDRVSCRIQAPCLIKAWHAPCHVAVTSNSEKKMPAFIRYSFFGFVALALSACGSSGSSRLLGGEDDSPMGEEESGMTSSPYAAVEYLITNRQDAIEKFVESPDAETPASTDATAPTRSAARLNADRNSILFSGTRYLSTGAMLARTTEGGAITDESSNATCSDGASTGASAPANCVFGEDAFRAETTFHLGLTNTRDNVNDVGFRSFTAERQAVMDYRDVTMSQVRTADPQTADLKMVYEDENGNEYLLTSNNVTNMNLTDVVLPMGVETAPDFDRLFAVYEDEDGNRYLLTPDNVTSMNLIDVELPADVATAPAFATLSRVTEDYNYEYVGYDGILEHSMFYVGIYRSLDDGYFQFRYQSMRDPVHS